MKRETQASHPGRAAPRAMQRGAKRAAGALILGILIGIDAQAGVLSDLLHAHADTSKTCKVVPAVAGTPFVINEVFPQVIYKTPGRDLGSEQLFEPIRKIAEPLARLGSQCLLQQANACRAFKTWVQDLARQDALRFDKERHRAASSVSLVTGALSGNLTIRPIALYSAALRDAGLVQFDDPALVDDWLARRAIEYDIVPKRISPKAAQNLMLNSILSRTVVDLAVAGGDGRLARAEQIYRLYLDTSRADGSFPEETKRGISALKYMNMAVSELVVLAEIAEHNGLHLYGYEAQNGVSLHKAVAFLLASILDEGTIVGYAAENFAPTDKPGTGQARYFLRRNFSWARIYLNRFPNSGNSSKIKRIIEAERIPTSGFYDDMLGMVVHCER